MVDLAVPRSSPAGPLEPGWDRRGRWSLRFVDPSLERAYQDVDQAGGVRRARTAALVAVGNWVAIAILGPR